MAKALIEEAAIAKIPSLIIDPQGDLARLALGIDEKDLTAQGGDVSRARKLLDMCEVEFGRRCEVKVCRCVSTRSERRRLI